MSRFQVQIIVLWNVFLLGLMFHTDLGLMPLFHGLSVAHGDPQAAAANVGWVLWLMLAFFTLPILMMILTAFSDSLRFRKAHFGLTALYSVLNLMHLVADLRVQPIVGSQIALMGMLLLIGIGLNIVGWQWMGEKSWARSKGSLQTVREN